MDVHRRCRTVSSCSDTSDHFSNINERRVYDISLDIFYKPHTLSLLSGLVAWLVYSAFTRNDDSLLDNMWSGLTSMIFFFLIISILAFPNGPFTRPHPAIWKIIFGLSVAYFMLLVFVVFQNYQTVRAMISWVSPDLKDFKLVLKLYAQNCSNVDVYRLWSHVDVYAFGHFVGWTMKAMLIRHYGICWTISVTWEITELAFLHLLPNFAECWWDAIVLDVLLCNGLGIYVGMQICRRLEMNVFHWESIKEIHSASGKLRRCILQFTPASWTHVRWLDPQSSYMRVIGVGFLVVMFQLSELNTFFLKHIFEVPTNHWLCHGRITFIAIVSAPSIRQFYSYVTDTQCHRLGTQVWVYIAFTFTEFIVCMKFGAEIFREAQIHTIVAWFTVLMLSSLICVYLCVLWARRGRALGADVPPEHWTVTSLPSEGTSVAESLSNHDVSSASEPPSSRDGSSGNSQAALRGRAACTSRRGIVIQPALW